MKYYKILNEEEKHNDMKYKKGLNTNILPFNPTGDCEAGGIHFASKDILGFLPYGNYIREVTLPENEEVYENLGSLKAYTAHRVILGRKRKITVKVIEELLDEGANIHIGMNMALRWFSENNNFKIVKLLLDRGANIHACDDYAIILASLNGYYEIVKLLLDRGADIHAYNDNAFRFASKNGHLETVKLLLDRGADIHACDDYALRWAFKKSNTGIVKLLLDRGADINVLK